jgi:signal transduction histidine kinase
VETFDKKREAQEIAEGAQTAVAASAALEIGAVGLGTLVTVLATTAAADITGVLLASVLAAVGLFIIPARRKQAKTQMREKVAALRAQLVQSLRSQFEREIERSLHNIEEAIAPYTRFVRAERGKLSETKEALDSIQDEIERLRNRVEEVLGVEITSNSAESAQNQ